MGNKIYVCRSCKVGFNLVSSIPKGQLCEKCQREPLTTLENWEEFICPKCKKKFELLTLQIMSDAQSITEGLVKCKFDATPLEWVPYEDKEGLLEKEFEQDHTAWQEILKLDFEEQKRKELELEAVILSESFKVKAEKTKTEEPKKVTFSLTLSDTISGKVELSSEKGTEKTVKTKDRKLKQKKDQIESEKTPFIIQKPKDTHKKEQIEKQSELKVPSNITNIVPKTVEPKEIFPTEKTIPIHENNLPSVPSSIPSSSITNSENTSELKGSESLWNDENVKLEELPSLTKTNKEDQASVEEKEPLSIPPLPNEPIKTSEIISATSSEQIEAVPTKSTIPLSESLSSNSIDAMRVETSVQSTEPKTEPLHTPAESVKPETVPNAIVPETIPIPEAEIKIPSTDKFWDFYYNQKRFNDPNNYLGGKDAEQEIIGLIGEINDVVFNDVHYNPKKPIIHQQSRGLVYYIGDTHGSVIDTDTMIRFFVPKIEDAEKIKSELQIIFIGDYVDRSPLDIHNLCYIFAFAIKYRKYVKLLRGNHEEITINSNYGFRKNVQLQFNDDLFYMIEDTFAKLSLIHTLKSPSGTIIALHGGIPLGVTEENFTVMPNIPKIDDPTFELNCQHTTIENMDILTQQILWNDPSIDLPPGLLLLPSRRGLGFNFGEEVFLRWLEVNHADRIIRAHEVFLEGHQEFFGDRLFSLFSASDYARRKIAAKILEIDLNKDWHKNWRHLEILKDLIPNVENKEMIAKKENQSE